MPNSELLYDHYNPMQLGMQAPLASRVRQSSNVPRESAATIGAPDACKSSLLGDIVLWSMDKGKHEDGTCRSSSLDVCAN